MKYCLFALVLLLRIVSLNAQDPNDPDDPYHDIDTINPFEVPLDILPAPCFVEMHSGMFGDSS